MPGCRSELGGEVPFLAHLRLVELDVRRLEIGAGILQVAVEEERVEPPVEVVVVGDVVACAGRGVATGGCAG